MNFIIKKLAIVSVGMFNFPLSRIPYYESLPFVEINIDSAFFILNLGL